MGITNSEKIKFNQFSEYQNFDNKYFLLPFRFTRLNNEKELLVNEVGDFLLVPSGTVERIIKRQLDIRSESNLIADLTSKFFICQTQIPELLNILSVRYRTKKAFLEYFTSLHIFVITLRCNHSCQYCQVSRVSEENEKYDMSLIHIDKGIEFMLKSPNPYVTMEFQGGDSLLAFDKIKYAIEKTKEMNKEINKQIDYVICTNLAEINNDVLEYCKINNVLISTSLDGPEFLHNYNRRNKDNNSYELAINGIKKCQEYLGADRVSALMTTSARSLKYPVEIVEEYHKQGFKEIFLRSVNPYGYAYKNNIECEIEEFVTFYKRAFKKIIEYNLAGEYFVEIYAKILLEKILTPFQPGFVDLLSPAGLINSVIVFNYDGNVYPSDEARMLAEMNDYKFLMGSLTNDSYESIFNGSKAREIAEYWAVEALAGCSDCAFQSYCGADPVRNYVMQGDMYGYRPTNTNCQKNDRIIRFLFELIDSSPEVARVLFSWISSN